MKRLRAWLVGAAVGGALAGLGATVARGGHELPVYPSFYPHEIDLARRSPEQAGELLQQGKIQAFIGGAPRLTAPLPDPLRAIESLGSFVLVRVNPHAADACRVADAALAAFAAAPGGAIVHPYPVTPFHGDYLDFADRAEAAKARLAAQPTREPVDATLDAVDAAGLVAAAATSINGWLGPPWLRAGWYQALMLLGDALDDADAKPQVEALRERLISGRVDTLAARINLERDLVGLLTAGCRVRVAGYTIKREYISAEYSAGIENIGYDAITGLASPMFLRTVKLKDFPWNGWLALGINGAPAAAWNPIAGMNDPFGRLLWSALGDPAVLPVPGDAGWVLNRIADVRVNR
jgi:hypothetical protein